MDDIIHLLPDSVANQIAAGEVVQRPASIVKEMVENAIDAGATRVQVLATDGGKTCVQVIDDGKGMSETDARLSFERHATSKISSAADLFSLHTMGFRGEALASIAAVAQVDLKTRRAVDELGTYIQVAGSKVERQEPIACPVGSNFAVKNLFFNVPARRKFLKSNQTEMSNIVSEFERIALVYPDIAFTLCNNGTEVYRLDASSARQRILDVFGRKVNTDLLSIGAETSIVRISGYVGKPESARKKGSHQFFFVNGRYMKNPYFHSAVMHAFDNLVPAGEHVSYFIYLTVEASTIDVNVHPTKTEIKFDNEREIWQILSAVVKEALGKYSNVPVIDFDVADRPDIPAMGQGNPAPKMPQSTGFYNPFEAAGRKKDPYRSEWQRLYSGLETFERKPDAGKAVRGSLLNAEEEVVLEGLVRARGDEAQPTLWSDAEADAVKNMDADEIAQLPCFQYRGRFLVLPSPNGLMFVDQHRAHVRILYEEYMQRITTRSRVSQRLLFPEVVQFSQNECLTVEAVMDELESIGFELSNLGGGSYSVMGVPSGIDGLNPEKLLHDLVYVAMERGTSVKSEVGESIALAMAQSAAIVYGQVLTADESSHLLSQLFRLPTPMRTPDGKIVFNFVEHRAIEHLFG